MRRWFRHLVPALLFAVCVLVLAAWAESYRRLHWTVLLLRPSGFNLQTGIGKGQLLVQYSFFKGEVLDSAPPGLFVVFGTSGEAGPIITRGTFWRDIGFYWTHHPRLGSTIVVPHWFVLLLAAPLPAWHFLGRRLRRRRRLRRGLCPRCGYDLTANATGVCPECGTPVLRPAAAAPRRTP